MKTDRELLVLAAKAADWYYPAPKDRSIPDEVPVTFTLLGKPWNPLEDDGDALRLAVKLHLWEAIRTAHRLVDDVTDIYAATRRAIVRAAAEIGELMQ